jgi:L-serine dehydratase
LIPSIFNDVIGPVMRGASSSHCAAALRIGRLARDLMDGDLMDVLVEFDRGGALPTTHGSQGSDMGLFGGLLGWDAADDRLPGSAAALGEARVRARIAIVDAHDPHPNTYRLTLRNARETHRLIAISTGGGMIEVVDIDGIPVSIGGDYFETLLFVGTNGREVARAVSSRMAVDEIRVHDAPNGQLVEVRAQAFVSDEILAGLRALAPALVARRLSPVLPVLSRADVRVPFSSCEELIRHDAGRHLPLWHWAIEYERARGGLSEAEVLARMVDIVRVLRRSIAHGISGTSYDDRILGAQSGGFDRTMREGRLLNAGALNRAVLYVTALMEVKSAMGVIVAAPTAGACAALPAACVAMAEEMQLSEEDMARGLLAAGLIGVFITGRWTFAAEVGGCQAEGGSAAAMAAAALVTLAGGTLPQTVAASSMALQGMLGLICDPVAGRVEVPCLSKNVLAASHALSCANMALADFDPVIPFDEVVDAARRVAGQMPRELRCTSLGGLATTTTALRIQTRLSRRPEGGGGGLDG